MAASLGVAVSLADCAGHGRPSSDERANAYPENYKTDLLGFLHTYVNDPTQIRDAAIADPVLMPVSGSPDRAGSSPGRFANPFDPTGGSQERYVVCVRYNAKDRDGRYTGLKQGMAVYVRGRFDRFTEQPRDQQRGPCEHADFKPFPELEALGR